MELLELMPARVHITSILKKALLAGKYKSGQELSLTEIAERLGVNRTPVREAFQTLAAEGLIESRMNKGAIVKPINQKFITGHYEMRILLESEAVAKAIRNGLDVSELLTELYRMVGNMDMINRSYYTELNQRIHMTIWKTADNQKPSNFLMNLWNGLSISTMNSELEHYRQSIQEHIEILQATHAGDITEGKRIMEWHIHRSMDNTLKSFQAAHPNRQIKICRPSSQ